jgi:hypothetical protein
MVFELLYLPKWFHENQLQEANHLSYRGKREKGYDADK